MKTPKNTDVSLSALEKTVRDTLLAGGAILRRGFSRERRVSYKTPTSPVTQVDLASEKKIVGLIRKRFPSHGFLAEESSHVSHENARLVQRSSGPGYRWVIDPLDGTVNYLHRVPQSCVSVAVEKGGVTLAGGVYDPFRDELFIAVKGRGATLNKRRIRVSSQRNLRHALLITGFPYDRDVHFKKYLKMLEPFLKASGGIRRFGSAALDLSWVACGRADGFWELSLNPWDVAAGCLLVSEAGGRVTNFSNKKPSLDDTEETLATNGLIHTAMVRKIKN